MDPLSDVLTLLGVRTAYFSRLEAGGSWALRFPGYRHIKVNAVLSGTCWLTAGDAPPLRLAAGDCYVLSGSGPYVLGDHPDTPAQDGPAVFMAAGDQRSGITVQAGSDPQAPDRAVIVGGSVALDASTAPLLLDSLPTAFRIPARTRAARVLRPTLGLIGDETASRQPGGLVMGEHLTQVLFVQALRGYLALAGGEGNAEEPGGGEATGGGEGAGRGKGAGGASDRAPAAVTPGWLGALREPRVGRALTLMHRAPAHRWTVAELAASVGMSRSSFAERFRALVGLPPLDYLLRWRIRAAARELRDRERTVASVAAEWGYSSESSFSTAFKRVTGESPARYRAHAGPGPGVQPPLLAEEAPRAESPEVVG